MAVRLSALALLLALAAATPSAAQDLSREQGICALTEGDITAREEACTALIDSGRLSGADLAEAYVGRARVYLWVTWRARALADLDEALRLSPGHAEAHFLRGNAYFRDQLPEAVVEYGHAIRLNPDYAEAYLSRGRVHARAGDFTAAVADFTQVIRLRPDDAVAWYERGRAHARSLDRTAAVTPADRAAAVADFSEAIRLDPGMSDAWWERYMAHLALGESEKASADRAEHRRLTTRPRAQPGS